MREGSIEARIVTDLSSLRRAQDAMEVARDRTNLWLVGGGLRQGAGVVGNIPSDLFCLFLVAFVVASEARPRSPPSGYFRAMSFERRTLGDWRAIEGHHARRAGARLRARILSNVYRG